MYIGQSGCNFLSAPAMKTLSKGLQGRTPGHAPASLPPSKHALLPGSFHVPTGFLVLPCQWPGPQGWGEEGGQKRVVLSPPVHFLLQKVLKQPARQGWELESGLAPCFGSAAW